MRDIYISSNKNSLTKFINSSRSTETENILPWNISQLITKTILITTRIVISYAMKLGILFWVWEKSQWKLRQQHDQNFPMRESHCKTNTSVRRKKSTRAGLWESQSGIRVGKLTIWGRSFEINYNRFHLVYQFHTEWSKASRKPKEESVEFSRDKSRAKGSPSLK